ncbi:MAG: tRNA 2-thiouridine(34) synthase MnmA [Gammaproteobacteria bacterium]|nr:tRNA 2-thiouridine(34) synthase MnmA [Gammaproteobacteria bacterium]
MARVVVALSGGVDSAVAAALLQDAGHHVEALFMANWAEDDDGYCTSAADFQDASRVCEELGIPLHKASFAREYRERVFARFLAELEAGRTPNPDVLCNREVKFGVALDYAGRLGAERFATGHYARKDGRRLLRGVDRAKDQSYFLHALDAGQLASAEFPVGGLRKAEVRRIARERGLPVADKRDSTGICFIGERPFGDFVGRWLPGRPGAIETPDGAVIGRHRGLERYTLGQRSGLGIGGRRGAVEAPWFVAGKDLARNVLIVVQGAEHPALLSMGVRAAAPHWIAGAPPAADFCCTMKLRYRQPDAACRVTHSDGVLDVRFDAPLAGAAPGQYVVFYDGEECLGGAAIMTLHPLEDACRTASRPAASSRRAAAATSTSRSTRSASPTSDGSPTR